MTNRLLVVDDDPEITSALARGLALHGYDAVTENRADLALLRLTGESFAGAIIDVMLGADSGLDLVAEARRNGVSLPIIMLSALSDVEHRTKGLEAGADDYVVKPFSFDELVARLRVQERRAPVRPGPTRLIEPQRLLQSGDVEVTLTERECDLLLQLMTTDGAPQSRRALYVALWGGAEDGNENVVDVYIGYLRKKLNAHDFGFEIKTIRHKGFCIEGTAPQLVPRS